MQMFFFAESVSNALKMKYIIDELLHRVISGTD